MILHCPECDAEVRAANINVQEMAAVCQECNTVFSFTMADVGGKQKRRKYKAPSHLAVTDDAYGLTMRYRRVYSEDERGFVTGNGFFAVLLPLLTVIASLGGAPVWLLVILGLWTLASWYAQAAMMFNTTSITLDDETLRVTKGPLPWITGANNIVFDRASVVDVTITETSSSRQGSGIKRFHHVRVQQPDGDAITILPGIPQAYARYIAQELNAVFDKAAVDDFNYGDLNELAYSMADEIDEMISETSELELGTLPSFLDDPPAERDDFFM